MPPTPSRAGWVVAAAGALGLIAVTVWLSSYPGGLPGDLWLLVVGPVVALAWLGVATTFLFTTGSLVYRRVTRGASGGAWPVVASALALAVGIGAGTTALRVRYELSEGALREIALDPRAGKTRFDPGRAGLYDVERVSRGPGGSLLLITGWCNVTWECGFAYSPNGRPPDVCADSNVQEYSHLSGPWYEARLTSADLPCD